MGTGRAAADEHRGAGAHHERASRRRRLQDRRLVPEGGPPQPVAAHARLPPHAPRRGPLSFFHSISFPFSRKTMDHIEHARRGILHLIAGS